MTTPQFSRPGAIDLSALRKPPTGAGSTGAAAIGTYSFDVTSEESLRTDVVDRSMSVVVLVSFWSAEAPASVEINATLTKLADEYAGRLLFARLDVGSHPDLAEALGIPQVPLVVAALRGQLAPLIQEPLPEPQMRTLLEQILQAAAANGVTGTSDPVGPAATETSVDTEVPDESEPTHSAAEEAFLAGDLDAAIEGYEKALQATPGDAEAAVGLARAQLLKRTQAVDPATAREAAANSPGDVHAQTLVADIDLLGGHVDDAFARLVDLVRRSSGDDKDAARKHLIEMFGVVGDDDPRVAKARQLLASALF
ncbi:MAG: tetratricopeptide repeat protein [Nocardioidaceae bacterium]|nr:tetratricopeptide repeat protein [Nocardioidaceae bacterium]